MFYLLAVSVIAAVLAVQPASPTFPPSSPVPPSRPLQLTPPENFSRTGRYKTKNVVLVMCDGLRWQEVFSGADVKLITKEQGVSDVPGTTAAYVRDTPEARRELLLPFIWGTAAKQGVLYGNRTKGSLSSVTNQYRVSYPGYTETLCGFPGKNIKDNRKIENPDVTVFEYLHGQPGFAGKVAAFTTWDVFSSIFNTQRCGFPVFPGVGPIAFGTTNDAMRLWDVARAETPCPWSGSCYDSASFRPAMEWIKLNTPRLVFLGLGETDEFAHEGKYRMYLDSAHKFDAYVKDLWTTLQGMEQYKDTTTLILTCDHGRGGGSGPGAQLNQWRDHNDKTVGAEETWMIVMGPDTPALGERIEGPAVNNSQVAATIATLLGADYNKNQPRAGMPLSEVLKPSTR